MLATLFGYLYAILTNALTAFYFWNWFLAPISEGIPEIAFAQAVGLTFVFTLFQNGPQVSESEAISDISRNLEDKSVEEVLSKLGALLGVMIHPWILLILGFIVHMVLL